jgi:penicillin-binding protein 1C
MDLGTKPLQNINGVLQADLVLGEVMDKEGVKKPGSKSPIAQFRWPNFRSLRHLLLFLGLGLLGIRLLPYFFPIHAQDIRLPDQSIEFRDRNGLLLGKLLSHSQDQHTWVKLSSVSPLFTQAILAAEDQDFYHHGPLDLAAIARAIFQAIQTQKIESGASTITMQLARMLGDRPRHLGSKLAEIWVAWRLAAGMNRTEILTAYVNRLPMGGNIYGIEAASQTYFGISAQSLSLSQATLLAAIPNNPSRFNPYHHFPALKQRQRYILDRLVATGQISASQGDRAYQEPLTLQPRSANIVAAPHFLFWLASQLPKDHPYQIRTTIDLPLQQFVETQLREVISRLKIHNVHQGAVLVLDNHSGQVLAYAGSKDYVDAEALGGNDGVQSLRQPGSTLKPFLYELALEKRIIHPNTILADVPTHYAIPGAKLYSPSDYSSQFAGPVRVRLALANSLNIPAVKVLEKVGVPQFLTRLQKLGFKHLNQPPEYYGLGLTLGSGEVNLWELANAYRAIALQGQVSPLVTTLPSQSKTNQPLILGQISSWGLITDMLSDRYARAKSFGVESILNLPFATAVKTGTSSNFRDTWTVGFSRDYTVGVWVGNFDGEPMRQVSGVMGAAPLWNRIFLKLHELKPPQAFDPPAQLISKPICALSGLKPTPACPLIVSEYFWPVDLADYETNRDRFYRTVNSAHGKYKLNLPSEYDQWLAQQPELQSYVPSLKILFPEPNAQLLIPEQDKLLTLAFKIANPEQQSVEWWLNGIKIKTSNEATLFGKIQPGAWQLMIKKANSTAPQDQVNFTVNVAIPIKKRGFSLQRY